MHLHPGPVVLVCAAVEENLFISFTLCQAELQKLRQQALETKHFIEKQEAEERKLLRIIAEADGERLRQKKELDQVESPHQTLISSHQRSIPIFMTPLSSLSNASLIGRSAAEAHLVLSVMK